MMPNPNPTKKMLRRAGQPRAIAMYTADGQRVVVDAVDYEVVKAFPWCTSKSGDRHYVMSNTDGRKYLHRFIMDAPAGLLVDHKNGDPLDCRRSNLRLATRSQNTANSRKRRGKTTSRYKGVSWQRRSGKWSATVYAEGITYRLGVYVNELDAARAYDRGAARVFGEFAKLNFPDETAGILRKSIPRKRGYSLAG